MCSKWHDGIWERGSMSHIVRSLKRVDTSYEMQSSLQQLCQKWAPFKIKNWQNPAWHDHEWNEFHFYFGFHSVLKPNSIKQHTPCPILKDEAQFLLLSLSMNVPLYNRILILILVMSHWHYDVSAHESIFEVLMFSWYLLKLYKQLSAHNKSLSNDGDLMTLESPKVVSIVSVLSCTFTCNIHLATKLSE